MRIIAVIAVIGIGLYGFKYQQKSAAINMKNFSKAEFGAWFPVMNVDLLNKLDALREAWGDPIIISPALGSIGRTYPLGHSNYNSRHNVTKYNEVQAIDIMPLIKTIDGVRGLAPFELKMIYNMAVDVGFTGIGVYPNWLPHAGLHVDVRDDHAAGNPATWSGIKTAQGQKYFGVNRGFA